MSDVAPPDPHETVVEQAVERAAVKVAEAATTTATNGTVQPMLNKMESLAVVAVIVILQLATLFILTQARNDTHMNGHRIQQLCKITSIYAQNNPNSPITPLVAECLK